MTMRYSLRNRILNEYVIPIGILVQQNLYNWNNRKLREEVMSPKAQLGGIYPRSEQLIELTRSYDRAKTDLDTVKKQIEQDTLELVKLQDDSGFETFSDGAFAWQDQLRPVVESQLVLPGEGSIGECFEARVDRKSTPLNFSHNQISYAVFCLKKKK